MQHLLQYYKKVTMETSTKDMHEQENSQVELPNADNQED